MLIDCDACEMQHTSACDDCVVTAIIGIESGEIDLIEDESAALEALAGEGLVPVLRLVPKRRAG